jgi:uncharacterized protein (DUF2235 family)
MTGENTNPRNGNERRILALFLDGTWNDTGDNTNVWRLKSLCTTLNASGRQQLTYYDRGVNGFWGGSFGKGLIENVVQGYEWLVENYNDGDEVFIFGFSRGAFTARSLAGFITKQGLLTRGAPLGVGQIYDRYKRSNCETIYNLYDRQQGGSLKAPTLEERWTLKYSRRIDITMVGVWDTVGALGIPAFSIPGLSTSTLGFLHTGLRQSIRNAFQAVAIDEHRFKFAPTLWTKLSTTAAARDVDPVDMVDFLGAFRYRIPARPKGHPHSRHTRRPSRQLHYRQNLRHRTGRPRHRTAPPRPRNTARPRPSWRPWGPPRQQAGRSPPRHKPGPRRAP